MADGNISSIQLPDGGIYNVKDNTSGFITGMTILSYGTSTWNDFITAYNANKVVYCRASSNSNPASGSQTRLAFMAYVNNATSPTEVEFQYYRSVSSHSDSQQGDQVFVYKITSAGTWSVTTRDAFTKIVAGGDLTGTYANGTLTISADIPTVPTNVSAFTNDAGYLTSEVNSNWVNGSQTGSIRTITSQVENSDYTIGQYAVAEGAGTKASGMMSHAEGGGTVASGQSAHAEGASTIASGAMSHAEGGGATASGNYSHAEGQGSTANGQSSHAEGGSTVASGQSSHAEGGGTTASGNYSHAEGGGTIANHRSQHVFGEWNITDSSSNTATEQGNYVEIVGNGTSSTRSNARTLDWLGNEVLAGKLTIGANPTAAMDVVTKQYMENQGYLTSYTETDPTVPSWAKQSSKPTYTAVEVGALPNTTTIPSKTSDLTNDSNFISDSAYIHTDNNYTTTEKNKLSGIAEGAEVNVNANWNENDSTSASYIQNRPFYFEEDAEVVIFEEDVNFANTYNDINWTNFSYTFTDAIAVGTPVILTVDDITLNTTIETEYTSYYFIGIRNPDDSTRANTNHIGLTLGGANGYAYQTSMVLASASVVSTGMHHVKLTIIVDVYHKIDNNFLGLNIENGSGVKSIQQIGATAIGDYSSAFGGTGSTSTGIYSHAEGRQTTAGGTASHAEGYVTTASYDYSHAEGRLTTAGGTASHAEGSGTTASGTYSHAEGYYTIANHSSQHVFGYCNIADPSDASTGAKGTYVEIVGNGTGTSTSARSNARTLDWSGNEWLAGKLTLGTAGTNTMDVATIGQLPTKVSDLTNDSGFITGYTETDPVFLASAAYGISASDISNWNGKSDFSGSYNDLTNKPTIPDAVSITRKTTTGTNIADITIGNTTTQLYAPSSGTQVQLVRW